MKNIIRIWIPGIFANPEEHEVTLRCFFIQLSWITSLFPYQLMYSFPFKSYAKILLQSAFLPTFFASISTGIFLPFMHPLIMVAAILKRPRTPPTNNPAMDYQTADSEHVLKRSRPFGLSDEVLHVVYNLNLPTTSLGPITKFFNSCLSDFLYIF